jgi:hypothetical protein
MLVIQVKSLSICAKSKVTGANHRVSTVQRVERERKDTEM